MPKKILNLGCGRRLIKGALNVDLLDIDREDYIKSDVLEFLRKKAYLEEWDEIHLHHIIEHFDFETAGEILFRCWEALKCGGRIVVITPDFDALVRRYLELKEKVGEMKAYLSVHYDIFSTGEFTHHKICFVPELLQFLLEEVGFEVERLERGSGSLGVEIFVVGRKVCKSKSRRKFLEELGVEYTSP